MVVLKVREEWFVPWILSDYSPQAQLDAWNSGRKPREFALDVAGLIPISHIQNWEEVKEHFSEEEIEDEYIAEWNDFKVEWVVIGDEDEE